MNNVRRDEREQTGKKRRRGKEKVGAAKRIERTVEGLNKTN